MSTRLIPAGVALGTLALLGAATAWLLWPAEPLADADPTRQADRLNETPVGLKPGGEDADGALRPSRAEVPLRGEDSRSLLWNKTKRLCPWPPVARSWLALDAECLGSMDHWIDEPSPNAVLRREAFNDPLGTKAAVAAALNNPDCRVREGETRPDLYEACAARDMVRLTVLHQWCAMLMGHGFEAFESVENLLEWRLEEAAELAPSQDSYYREIEDAYEDAAKRFYRYHMCTGLPPGALQPLDDLVPENLLLAEHGDLFARSNPDGTRARRAARQRSLYELARRLGSQEEMHFVIMEHAPPRTIRPEPRPSDKQRIQGGVE